MELRHLSVRNIRSYERAEVDFPSGTTLISGDVGAGKTSLLYAIEMALFGFAAVDAPFLVRHGAVHAEVTVTLADESHTYEIGRRFRKAVRKGKDSFEIERLTYAKDGTRAAYSATEIRRHVSEILGFPDDPNPRSHSDVWRWAVYVPQERMREVLGQDPHERLETVRRALGVERYRLAAENSQVVAREIRHLADIRRAESAQLGHWEAELAERSRELEDSEVRLAELAREIAQVEVDLATAQAELERTNAELQRAEGDRREQEGLERESARDQSQLARLDHEERGFADQLRELESLDLRSPNSLDAKIAGLEAQLRSAEDRRSEVTRDRASVELRARELAQAEQSASLLARARSEAERSLAVLREEADLASAELARAQADGPSHEPPEPTRRSVAEIERALADARNSERSASDGEVRAETELQEIDRLLEAGECPRCHQAVRPTEFAAHRSEAAATLARAAQLKRDRTEEVRRFDEERRARERYERALERWQSSEQRRAAARDRAEAASLRRTDAEAAAQRAQAEAAAAQLRATDLAPARAEEDRLARELGRVEEQAHRVAEELAAARGERQKLGEALLRRETLAGLRERTRIDREELSARMRERTTRLDLLAARTVRIAEIRALVEGAHAREASVRDRRVSRNEERVRIESRAASARQRTEEAKAGVLERGARTAEARQLEATAQWLSGPFREALLRMEQRILSQAQGAFQRDFARFFAVLIDDPLLEARVGAGFDPTVLINGAWTPADALSGGERTALALAFRLALGRVVRTMGSLKLDTLILDEPTDGFSPEQIVRMGELLRDLSLPQLVLVSHESQLSSVADRVVRTAKSGGRSELVVDSSETPPVAPPQAPEVVPARRRRAAGRAASAPPGGDLPAPR